MDMMQPGQPPEAEEQEDPGTFEVKITKEGVTLNGQPTDLRSALEQIVSAYEKAKLDGGDPFEAGLQDTTEPRQKPMRPADIMVR